MNDNFITMTRGIIRFLLLILLFCTLAPKASAQETLGIISDAILTKITPYNAYFKTPEFFLQDVRGGLVKKGIPIISIDDTKELLKEANITQYDLESLIGLQEGYSLDFKTLKKIGNTIGTKKLVIMTSSIDIQRDFLKNTLWNVANVQSMDVVNPTHRVSVYVAFVDLENEVVLWEQIYAKNIRNNKFKNLDTTISNNHEGMLRLKEYSKYISPEIIENVAGRANNPNYKTPPQHINRVNVIKYFKDKKNIGSKKPLSEIDEQKWDTEKLKNDTKENIEKTTQAVKKGAIKAKDGIVNTSIKIKEKILHETL